MLVSILTIETILLKSVKVIGSETSDIKNLPTRYAMVGFETKT